MWNNRVGPTRSGHDLVPRGTTAIEPYGLNLRMTHRIEAEAMFHVEQWRAESASGISLEKVEMLLKLAIS